MTIDRDRAADLLLLSAEILVRAGADFLISPDNTIHQALDLVRDRSPAPWLHIAEEVAAAGASRGFKRLGILGTRYLMEGPVYPPKLDARGLAYEIPGDRGCDAVVLGCTEIPLLISGADSALPAIDSTRTLARAALREATR